MKLSYAAFLALKSHGLNLYFQEDFAFENFQKSCKAFVVPCISVFQTRAFSLPCSFFYFQLHESKLSSASMLVAS